jgi:hypothetical protein
MSKALELADACRALTSMMMLVPGLDTVECEAELRRQHAEIELLKATASSNYGRGHADAHSMVSARVEELESEIEALRKDADWQPIETAPENVSVLAVNDCGYVGRAMKERGRWNHIGSPTHWKPLPTPPKMGEKA